MLELKDIIAKRKTDDAMKKGGFTPFFIQMISGMVKQYFDDMKPELFSEVKKILLAEDTMEKLKGEPGYTPVKGVDYTDGETPDEEAIEERVLAKIPPPIPGKPGYTPIKGVDYKDGESPSDEKLEQIIIKKIPPPIPGKDGSPDTAEQIATKVNTLEEAIEPKAIKGLQKTLSNLNTAVREKTAGKKGGGMGNTLHEQKSVSSATTSVSTNSKIAANGYALWVYYQGQFLSRGTHYTVGTDQKTLTLLITLADSTFIDLVYIRT